MEKTDLTNVATDRLEQALLDGEATVARIRSVQIRVLTELDLRQVPIGDGARSLSEWAAARMDLAPETAQRLTQTAQRLVDQPDRAAELAKGEVSFDRVVEESRLVTFGADPELVARSRGWDIGGLRRLVAHHKRITRQDELQTYRERFLAVQPTLDQSSYKLWGRFSGIDGRLIENALQERADQFPAIQDGEQSPRAQRQADALVSIAQDSLDGTNTKGTNRTAPLVSIFLDAELAGETGGEAGASIDTGPRVGPITLEQILCEGQVETLTNATDGTPLTVGPTARTIPPKLRRFILHRDGGICTADGCDSRYRLQAHHITPKSQGGTHQPENLTTLCWYHHHVVVHRNGHRINPDTPPQRRRFLGPGTRAPP